ncbi:hypothetical protein [Gracilimonas amylolytica]|uniref:hypothetical protein n=1 Tax=Gracilimonas amylolytica TaxID=1749045 RepID=UPI0012FFEA46|nr:hypothetical protein [Gracilimonas amylolytica]
MIKKICPALLIGTLLLLQLGCGNEKKNTTEKNAEPVKIYVSTKLNGITEIAAGDTLRIDVNETDEMYQLIIRRIQENIPGIKSISAVIGDQETGLATLIYRDGRLSGFMDMYVTNKRWQIEYDEENNSYYLNEIKPEDRDELEGGEPLTPPNEMN